MSRIPKPIKLSQLKGISIYFKDDFYQTAKLVLKIYDGRRKRLNESGVRRPTIHGMIRIFASLSNECDPKTEFVEKEVLRKKWHPNSPIKFDDEIENLDVVKN